MRCRAVQCPEEEGRSVAGRLGRRPVEGHRQSIVTRGRGDGAAIGVHDLNRYTTIINTTCTHVME